MKPKEYIQYFQLEKGWNTKVQEEFLQKLTSELLAFLEYNKAVNNIKGFDNAVKVIRMKWDSISNKIPNGLPEKLWSYFWATTVSKLREELCPREMEIRRKEAEERRKERELYKEQQRRLNEMLWGDFFFDDIFERLFAAAFAMPVVPADSFQYLGLPETATSDEIKKRFREMSMTLHPDHGGKQEDFIQLTEHKNRCLKWANK